MLLIILVQGFCPLKIKIIQFPDGFCPKIPTWFKNRAGLAITSTSPKFTEHIDCFLMTRAARRQMQPIYKSFLHVLVERICNTVFFF